ncbi:3958_t:CDS:2, partial [Dentiscutata erythropus]
GYTNITEYTYELFYLDLSTSFENDKLTWTSIPDGFLPIYTWRSTAVLSLDNSTIYLYGGYMMNKDEEYDFSNLVYTYDYPTSTWSVPKLGGDPVPPRQDIKGVIDKTGKMYIFGGFNATNLTSNRGVLYNDMNVLNTVSNTWTTLSISGSLPNRANEYAVNILPNGIIVYFGGIEMVIDDADFTVADINKIKLFDTNTNEWSLMDATGDVIESRISFSSVL